MRHVLVALTLVLTGAGVALAGDPTLPPKPLPALLAWLRAGAYRDTYTPEPTVRVSSEPESVTVDGRPFPILWSIIGGAVLVALLNLLSGAPRGTRWRYR